MDYTETKLAENKRGELYFMVGSARSGKSTISKNLAKELNAIIITPDSFRLAIHNQGFLLQAEPTVWSHVDVAVRAILINGDNVLLDEVNVIARDREHWRSLGGKGFYVQCPLEVCLGRANEENNEGFKDSIRDMHKNLETFDPYDKNERIVRIYSTPNGTDYSTDYSEFNI